MPPDPVEWIEGGGVILPSSVGAKGVGGRLSFAAAPWWRVPLRWLADEETECIFVGAGSQQGKTTWGIAVSAYCLRWLPGPQTYAMPTDDHAERLVRERLRPIFQASPFAKGLKSENLRLGGATIPGGGTLDVTGVGSPSALKAHPARIFIFDEYDEAIRKNTALGSPFKRAHARTRTYGKKRKVVVYGTPIKENDGITPLMDAAQRWEWHCPCPYCGVYQRLELGNVWWPRNESGASSAPSESIIANDLARYECANCHKHWDEQQRLQAIANGKEVCIDPDRPGIHKAFPRMSTLYSPFVRMSETAGAFLDALADPEAMKQFLNEWMSEPTRDTIRSGSTDQAHLVTKCVADYQQPAPDWWRSDDPPEAAPWVRAITWGFDVQGSEVWGSAIGWGDRGERIVLWAGKFVGATDLDDACFAFRRPWIIQGAPRKPVRGMMDSGYRTHAVYRACAKTPGLMPSKGRVDMRDPMAISQVDRLDANRRTIQGRTELVVLYTTYWQDQLAAALETSPGRESGAMHLPANPPAELLRHLVAERKKQVKSRDGTLRYQWVAHDPNNHLRDCLVYATAAAGHAKCLDLAPPRKAPAPAPVAEPLSSIAPQATQAPQAPQPRQNSSVLSRIAAARGGNSTKITTRRL